MKQYKLNINLNDNTTIKTATALPVPDKTSDLINDNLLYRQIREVDAVTQPTNSSNYVVYHITDSTITSLTEGLTIRVHKGLASSWPKDSSGALKLIQINNLDPIAIFWRYNSFASWNSFDNVMMTLTYSATARPSSSDYYGYKSQAGFILDFTYDSGNDVYNLYDYGGYHTGSSALTAYSLVGWDAAGNRVPVINADGTAGVAFDYSRGVQYWETAVNASQNRAPWTGSAWYPRVTATILSSLITRYSFGTLATTDRIYIKCSKSGRMLTPIALTKTLPSAKDNYYYMLFAKPYQEYTNYTSNQTWTIFINQPIYYHNGSAVVPLESDDSNVVHKFGTETITGSKLFTSTVSVSSGDTKEVTVDNFIDISPTDISFYKEGLEYPWSFDGKTFYDGSESSRLNLPILSSDEEATIAVDEYVVHKTGTETISGSKTFETATIEQGSIYSTYISRTYTRAAQLTNEGVKVSYHASGAVSADAAATIGSRSIVFTENETIGPVTDPTLPYYTSYGGTGILYNPAANDSSTAYTIDLPKASGTLALTDDIPANQNNTIIVGNALTNISGKSLSAYTSQETTVGGYPVIKILKDGSILSETDAASYMAAQSGSSYVPKYDYDNPSFSYFIFSDGTLYKPQWDATNGLLLYKMNKLVFDDNVVHKGTNSSYITEDIYGEKHFGGTVKFGAYSAGVGGFSSEGSISSSSLTSLNIEATYNLNLNANGYPGTATSGFSFKDYYKPSVSSTTYTSTYKFPNKTAANKSYTIATTDDLAGFVTGPNSVATAGNIVIYDGTTGKIIKDSTIKTSIGSSMSITLPLSNSSLYLGESTGSSYVCLTNSEGIGPSGQTGQWHYITDKISGNTYYHYLPKKTGILATTDDIPDDSNLVHKGTSSSSVAETIYGNKTFANKVDIYNGFEFRNAAYDYAPTTITSSNDGLKMYFNGSSQYLQLASSGAGYINIQPKASSVGTISNQYYKNSTLVTNTLTLPDASGSLAINEDVVHRTGDTMTGGLMLNIGSGYSSSPNLVFVTSNGAGSFYKNDETLYFDHTGVHSYTLTFPMQTGTVALTSQIPPRIQILDYRS